MITCIRTNSDNADFKKLVKELDADLKVRDGEDHAFYSLYNKTDAIKHVVVAYENNVPVGCGAVKQFSPDTMEVKRMYVPIHLRGKGIASIVLRELEKWSAEIGYKKCVFETGKRQPEAIRLYTKNGFVSIPNFGQYIGMDNSVCFEKELK